MSYSTSVGCGLLGIDAFAVTIEIHLAPAMANPCFLVVGLPDAAVRESRERVKGALQNSGYYFPYQSITVNLAPADLKKEGASLDLPIALTLLSAQGLLPQQALKQCLLVGELGLDGTVRPVRGALSRASLARELGLRDLILPRENAGEAVHIPGVRILPVDNLRQVLQHLTGEQPLEPAPYKPFSPPQDPGGQDLADVRGQAGARRALEVAASGGHNLLFIGPPGTGKSMLAKRLPGILPPLSLEEALQATRIHSVAGVSGGKELVSLRPFRSPHHTVSAVGLIGGTANPQPGEISLAHQGVLFLDELTEFPRGVLEVLRQPIEDGKITITRAARSLTFPSQFMLVAAANPCPCGYLGAGNDRCRCSPVLVERYQDRLSGPLLDRIDMHVRVNSLSFSTMQKAPPGETSKTVRLRVAKAHQVQQARNPHDVSNARLPSGSLRGLCQLDQDGQDMLEDAMENLGLSARAHDRILRLGRTIADLDGGGPIRTSHLREAIQYRQLDRHQKGPPSF